MQYLGEKKGKYRNKKMSKKSWKFRQRVQRSSEYQSSGYQSSWLLVPCGLAGLTPLGPPGTLWAGGTQSLWPPGTLWLAGLSPFGPPRYREDWRDPVLSAPQVP